MRRSVAGGLSAAAVLASLVSLALLASPAPGYAASSSVAPGAPGAAATWTPADKHGFGTATGTASKVWYTLEHGELTEVYYPDLGTPSLRDLQFIVTDGSTFADLWGSRTWPPVLTWVYAARSYSLMRPPRTAWRWIRAWERSAGGWSARGGRSRRLR